MLEQFCIQELPSARLSSMLLMTQPFYLPGARLLQVSRWHHAAHVGADLHLSPARVQLCDLRQVGHNLTTRLWCLA